MRDDGRHEMLRARRRRRTLRLWRAMGATIDWVRRNSSRVPFALFIAAGTIWLAQWALDRSALAVAGRFASAVFALSLLVPVTVAAHHARRRLAVRRFEGPIAVPEESSAKIKEPPGADAIGVDVETFVVYELRRLFALTARAREQQASPAVGDQSAFADIATFDEEDFVEPLPSGASISIGPVKLPAEVLAAVVNRLVRGPRLSGRVEAHENRLVITAQLRAPGAGRSWRVEADMKEEEPTADRQNLLMEMASELAHRIFGFLTVRDRMDWEALRDFHVGLESYLDSLRSSNERVLLLREAEKSFLRASRRDDSFDRARHNLALVYVELDKVRADRWDRAQRRPLETLAGVRIEPLETRPTPSPAAVVFREALATRTRSETCIALSGLLIDRLNPPPDELDEALLTADRAIALLDEAPARRRRILEAQARMNRARALAARFPAIPRDLAPALDAAWIALRRAERRGDRSETGGALTEARLMTRRLLRLLAVDLLLPSPSPAMRAPRARAALAVLELALALQPPDDEQSELLVIKGNALLQSATAEPLAGHRRRDLQDALGAFQKALQSQPGSSRAWAGLADARSQAGAIMSVLVATRGAFRSSAAEIEAGALNRLDEALTDAAQPSPAAFESDSEDGRIPLLARWRRWSARRATARAVDAVAHEGGTTAEAGKRALQAAERLSHCDPAALEGLRDQIAGLAGSTMAVKGTHPRGRAFLTLAATPREGKSPEPSRLVATVRLCAELLAAPAARISDETLVRLGHGREVIQVLARAAGYADPFGAAPTSAPCPEAALELDESAELLRTAGSVCADAARTHTSFWPPGASRAAGIAGLADDLEDRARTLEGLREDTPAGAWATARLVLDEVAARLRHLAKRPFDRAMWDRTGRWIEAQAATVRHGACLLSGADGLRYEVAAYGEELENFVTSAHDKAALESRWAFNLKKGRRLTAGRASLALAQLAADEEDWPAVLERLEGSEGAIALMEEHARAAAQAYDLRARRALATLRIRGDHNGVAALHQAEEAVELNKTSAVARDVLARVHLERGALDDALKEWETARRLDPDDPAIRWGLAICYLRRVERPVEALAPEESPGPKSERELACERVREAIDLLEDPEGDAALALRYWLGIGYAHLGILRRAAAELEIAARRPDLRQMAMWLTGESYLQAGDPARAETTLRLVIDEIDGILTSVDDRQVGLGRERRWLTEIRVHAVCGLAESLATRRSRIPASLGDDLSACLVIAGALEARTDLDADRAGRHGRARVLAARGAWHLDEGREADAIEDLEAALGVHPNTRAQVALVLAYVLRAERSAGGRRQRAREQAERTLDLIAPKVGFDDPEHGQLAEARRRLAAL